jgi:hypothetical protein
MLVLPWVDEYFSLAPRTGLLFCPPPPATTESACSGGERQISIEPFRGVARRRRYEPPSRPPTISREASIRRRRRQPTTTVEQSPSPPPPHPFLLSLTLSPYVAHIGGAAERSAFFQREERIMGRGNSRWADRRRRRPPSPRSSRSRRRRREVVAWTRFLSSFCSFLGGEGSHKPLRLFPLPSTPKFSIETGIIMWRSEKRNEELRYFSVPLYL